MRSAIPICAAVVLAVLACSTAHAQAYADYQLSGREPNLRSSLSGRNVSVGRSLSGTLPEMEMRLFDRTPRSMIRLSGRGFDRSPLKHQQIMTGIKLKDQFPAAKEE